MPPGVKKGMTASAAVAAPRASKRTRMTVLTWRMRPPWGRRTLPDFVVRQRADHSQRLQDFRGEFASGVRSVGRVGTCARSSWRAENAASADVAGEVHCPPESAILAASIEPVVA
jgi:hypothetical protein